MKFKFTKKVERAKVDTKDWAKILEQLKDLPPPALERREKCNHEHLSKVDPEDFLFVCDKCGQIIEIVGSFMYWPEIWIKKVQKVMAYLEEKNPDIRDSKNVR